MQYIFISDGGPDAEEYDNNYFCYHEENEATLQEVQQIIAKEDVTDPLVRREIRAICDSSLIQGNSRPRCKDLLKWFNPFRNLFNPKIFAD